MEQIPQQVGKGSDTGEDAPNQRHQKGAVDSPPGLPEPTARQPQQLVRGTGTQRPEQASIYAEDQRYCATVASGHDSRCAHVHALEVDQQIIQKAAIQEFITTDKSGTKRTGST